MGKKLSHTVRSVKSAAPIFMKLSNLKLSNRQLAENYRTYGNRDIVVKIHKNYFEDSYRGYPCAISFQKWELLIKGNIVIQSKIIIAPVERIVTAEYPTIEVVRLDNRIDFFISSEMIFRIIESSKKNSIDNIIV